MEVGEVDQAGKSSILKAEARSRVVGMRYHAGGRYMIWLSSPPCETIDSGPAACG
jgi:hypothetical protein